jgi:hypothetical protein
MLVPMAKDVGWLRTGRHGQVLRAARERLLGSSHRSFVDAAYRALLWRTADEQGRDHYVRGLSRGEFSRFLVLRDIGQSPEAAKQVLFGPGIREHVAEFTAAGRSVPLGTRGVCFLHTMKTGGTALAHCLSVMCEPWPRILDVWIDQLLCMPQPVLSQVVLVTGHLPHGALEVLPPGMAACKVVREPVGRTLSHFAHLRTFGQRPDLTLEDFLRRDEWRPTWVNYQARQLAVDLPVQEALHGRVGELQPLLDGPTELDDLSARSAARLASIELVGTTDDLDCLARQVADLWRKPAPPPLMRLNTSLAPVRELPAWARDEILAGTDIDQELYELARDRVRALG